MSRYRTSAIALLLLVGGAACGGSDTADDETAGSATVDTEADDTAPSDADEPQPAAGDATVSDDGADAGMLRAAAGDIDYELAGLTCNLGDGDFGPTGGFFLTDPTDGYTASYAFAPLADLTNERLTVTGPDGVLLLEHKQTDGEVLNTQTQEVGEFLFDPASPTLDFDTEVLFTVSPADGSEPTEISGTLTTQC